MAKVKRGNHLTTEPRETALDAASQAIWHDQQIEQLSAAFDNARAAGDFGLIVGFASLIEFHKSKADNLRQTLQGMGLQCRLF
jgi:hypothetical protein